MLKAMENCLHTINVRAFLLKDVYNIKEWLTPHAHELHDHTQPKSFKFIRNASGKCEMFYRNYSHMQWEGPVVVLRVSNHKLLAFQKHLYLPSQFPEGGLGKDNYLNEIKMRTVFTCKKRILINTYITCTH